MGDSWMYVRLSLEVFITERKPDWGRGRRSGVGLTQDRTLLITPGTAEPWDIFTEICNFRCWLVALGKSLQS